VATKTRAPIAPRPPPCAARSKSKNSRCQPTTGPADRRKRIEPARTRAPRSASSTPGPAGTPALGARPAGRVRNRRRGHEAKQARRLLARWSRGRRARPRTPAAARRFPGCLAPGPPELFVRKTDAQLCGAELLDRGGGPCDRRLSPRHTTPGPGFAPKTRRTTWRGGPTGSLTSPAVWGPSTSVSVVSTTRSSGGSPVVGVLSGRHHGRQGGDGPGGRARPVAGAQAAESDAVIARSR